jgi:hypothetical protein
LFCFFLFFFFFNFLVHSLQFWPSFFHFGKNREYTLAIGTNLSLIILRISDLCIYANPISQLSIFLKNIHLFHHHRRKRDLENENKIINHPLMYNQKNKTNYININLLSRILVSSPIISLSCMYSCRDGIGNSGERTLDQNQIMCAITNSKHHIYAWVLNEDIEILTNISTIFSKQIKIAEFAADVLSVVVPSFDLQQLLSKDGFLTKKQHYAIGLVQGKTKINKY